MKREELQTLKQQAGLTPYQLRLQNWTAQGAEYRATCPWHHDKSPSLAVYQKDDEWKFKCMSQDCDAGDVIDFIKKLDKLTFTEAVRKLSNDAGVAVPANEPQASQMNEITKEQSE